MLTENYQTKVLDGTLHPDPAQEPALAKLDALAEALAKPKRLFSRRQARGLYIHGPVGRGKSMLMDLFFAAAPVAAKRRVHFNAFMLDVHARLNQARAEHHADPLLHIAKDLAATRLLCFDEFQVKDVADAMILARLFAALLDAGVIVVATSNVAPEDLYVGGLQRALFLPFIDLLRQRLDIVTIGAGIDHRLARLAGKRVWFTSGESELNQLFSTLTEDKPPAPGTLDVAGRSLSIPLAAGHAARFTFDDLCRQPLGAADYLAIAAAYRVVFVSFIPLFDPAARNEAARFITLIDQLYETHTILVASAEAKPDALYPADGPYAFEFQRTASRLAEMQSAQYLSPCLSPLGTATNN